jgi:hypothetical protein
MTAGRLYVLMGLWMTIDKKSSKVPYIISMPGSVLLIGFYIASYIVGTFALNRVMTSRIFRLACCCFAGRNSYTSGYIIILSSSKTITRIQMS